MATTQSTRPLLRRDAIVEAAREMIRSEGLHALSLRRLASSLGATAPALYAHVEDKQDLLRAVAAIEFDHLVQRFAAVTTTDPLERIRAHSRAYIDHARENPELFDVMFLFPPDLGPANLPAGAELPAATRAFTIALEAVQAAIDAGELIEDDPILIALTLWTTSHGVAAALQFGFSLPVELEDRLVEESIDRLLAGWCVKPPKRRRRRG